MDSIRDKLIMQMHAGARAMASHALGTGLPVPPWVLATIARLDGGVERRLEVPLREIARVYQELARTVAPATPELLLMLYQGNDESRLKRTFGHIRITRRFMLAAVVAIVSFVLISLSSYINDPASGDFFTSSGLPLFVNELFFLSSAAIGAAFSNLFQVNREIMNGTYRPKDEPTYWVQFTLGIVAGLLMSTVLNISSIAPQDDAAFSRLNFGSALLALLGGFSSSVVQKVIQRIIDALETIVRGSAEQEIRVREQAGRLRMEERLARERMRTTLMLNDIQRRLGAGEDPEAVRALLEETSRSVLSDGGQVPQRPPGPAEPPEALEAAPAAAAEGQSNGGATGRA
jgi:hypothetical protein